jgi:hypothetical protein
MLTAVAFRRFTLSEKTGFICELANTNRFEAAAALSVSENEAGRIAIDRLLNESRTIGIRVVLCLPADTLRTCCSFPFRVNTGTIEDMTFLKEMFSRKPQGWVTAVALAVRPDDWVRLSDAGQTDAAFTCIGFCNPPSSELMNVAMARLKPDMPPNVEPGFQILELLTCGWSSLAAQFLERDWRERALLCFSLAHDFAGIQSAARKLLDGRDPNAANLFVAFLFTHGYERQAIEMRCSGPDTLLVVRSYLKEKGDQSENTVLDYRLSHWLPEGSAEKAGALVIAAEYRPSYREEARRARAAFLEVQARLFAVSLRKVLENGDAIELVTLLTDMDETKVMAAENLADRAKPNGLREILLASVLIFRCSYLECNCITESEARERYAYGIWRRWWGDSETEFEEARQLAMAARLAQMKYSFTSVEAVVGSSLFEHDSDGWFTGMALRSTGEFYERVVGCKVNAHTCNIQLRLAKSEGSNREGALFTSEDIRFILKNGIAHPGFLLKLDNTKLITGPFQGIEYTHPALAGSDYLATILHCQRLLSMLFGRVEVSARAPFRTRSADTLL